MGYPRVDNDERNHYTRDELDVFLWILKVLIICVK